MPITAGSISIGRRINTGDYSHKEAKVELHYVAEGDEDIAVLGGKAAHAALINVAQVLATVVKLHDTPEINVGEPAVAEEPKQEPAKRRGRPPKLSQTAAEEVRAIIDANMAPSDPTLSEPGAVQDAASPAAPASTDAPATGDATQAEISDKELNNACNETMNRIKNKVAIQETIARFTNGGVSTIPQEQRAHFLGLLKTL